MKDIDYILDGDYVPEINENRINDVVSMGQRYMETHTPRKTPLFTLFAEQIKYISPLLWLCQFIAIILIAAFVSLQAGHADNVRSVLLQVTPLISIMAVPELVKDTLYNMAELECSCKNRGSTILIMRLIAVGLINIMALVLISAVLAGVYRTNFIELLLYAFLPYNLANISTLFLIQVLKIRSRNGALALSLLSTIIVIAMPFQNQIIHALSTAVLFALVLITMLILLAQIICLLKVYPKGELIYGAEN